MILRVCCILAWMSSCILAKRGYLMTAPKVMHPGTSEKVCFTFFEIESTIDVEIRLTPDEDNARPVVHDATRFVSGEGRCVDIDIPHTPTSGHRRHQIKLKVSGQAVGDDYSFEDETVILLVTPGILTFIQTDKPQYKPGQTVQFRVLSLDAQLKPILGTIHAVWMENPSGVRMTQWLDVDTMKGLASFDMQLSEDPVLGDWKISVQLGGENTKIENKMFKVDEYVLPKYEISIIPPSFVPINTRKIKGEVCAKYTYGKPVKGQVEVKLCITNTYNTWKRPCITLVNEINGCYKFEADTAETFELQSTSYSIWGAKLKIEATVTEEATGVNLTTSDESAKIERYLLKLDFKPNTPAFFKPGLPFHGKLLVTAPDGTPLAGERIILSARKYRTEFNYNETITSNSAGEVLFTIPEVARDLASFTIEADAEGYAVDYEPNLYTPYEPRGYHYLKQWYSPSGSFVQIQRRHDTLPCEEEQEFLVSYTTEADTRFTFHYEIMARGNIIEKHHKTHHFKNHDSLPIDGGEREVAVKVNLQGPSRGKGKGKGKGKGANDRPEESTLDHVATFPLRIRISHQMSPLAHLLVYYIRDDGEVVADSVEFNVQKCLKNQVSLNFDPAKVFPGAETVLHLQAAPDSLCSVGVVDKSVHVLGGNNQVSPAKIFSILSGFDLKESTAGGYVKDDYCDKQLREKAEKEEKRQFRPARGRSSKRKERQKRSSMPWYPGTAYSDYYDSIKAFQSSAMSVLTDLTVETRPCQERPLYRKMYSAVALDSDLRSSPKMRKTFSRAGAPRESAPAPGGPSPEEDTTEQTVDIRTYFPETWLWELYNVGDSGERRITQEVPHTITDWVGAAFCTNTNAGFGVSEHTILRAFQPFFVSFTLPYSIVRGERVRIPVTVFNYLSECIVIELTMESTTQVQVQNHDSSRPPLCVCGNEAKTAYFTVEAMELGMVNLTAQAVSVKNSDWACQNRLLANIDEVRDAATKPILVEPEGIEEEYTYSNFVCPKDGTYRDDKELPLPSVGLVEGSATGQISVIGDVMGPTLSNLDSLLRLPTGCGEQNMLKFAPNIFVMQYLQATNQLTEEIKTKALGFMKTGYQRELTYRHDDGSYSAFGNNDDSGSTWLTAFVVRSFAQARKYIFIDQTDIDHSINWFRANQKENGCFRQVGKVLHKSMKGGLSSGDSDTGLTAYVLLALIEAGIPQTEPMVRNGLSCLQSQTAATEDMYTAAIVTYAYSWMDSQYAMQKANMMEKMEAMATKKDGLKYWSKPRAEPEPSPMGWWYHRPQSADVEMTAYALMAYLQMQPGLARGQAISAGLPIIQWLSRQRNSYGGFGSTQDTVVGLQALANYAALVYGGGIDLTVTFSDQHGNGFPTFTVSDENSLLLQRHPLSVPNLLSLEVTGSGCALVQANVKYNINPDATVNSERSFTLRVNVEDTMDEFPSDHCNKRRLVICARFNSEEPSNMAVVEVKMQTGWIANKLSLMALKKDRELKLKRYEIDRNKVHLYFDEFVNTHTCVNFLVEEEMEVSNPKDAFVHIYDYYETELSLTHNYKIKRTCGTKEELPDLTQDQYDDLVKSGFQGQLRVPDDNFPFDDDEEGETKVPCPQCYDSTPEDLHETICASRHVYKGVIKRRKVRILSDQRQSPPKPMNKMVNIKQENLGMNLEACSCPVLTDGLAASKNTNSRVLILTKEASIESKKSGHRTVYSLDLDEQTVVMPLLNEKEIKKIVKGCGR